MKRRSQPYIELTPFSWWPIGIASGLAFLAWYWRFAKPSLPAKTAQPTQPGFYYPSANPQPDNGLGV